MSSNPDDGFALRQSLADKLKREGHIRSPCVEAAFRAVPRHIFVPGIPVYMAYRDEAIAIKQTSKNEWLSSVSQPAIIAIMLEQLDLQPGHSVLEIGAGAGYNAALMAHIVGESGHVVTIDIDEDLVERANEYLAAAGYARVKVVCGDGALGCEASAPYDRIILTVSATDTAPAWREQLKPHGRLVLPIDFKNTGTQFSIAFDQAGDCLIGRSFEPCGFIRLRGAMSEQPEGTNRPRVSFRSAFEMNMMATVSQLLPKVGEQLWRRRANREVFGRSMLEGLRLRAYPIETDYVPSEGETVYDRPNTRFVIDWQTSG